MIFPLWKRTLLIMPAKKREYAPSPSLAGLWIYQKAKVMSQEVFSLFLENTSYFNSIY